ncbi:hypothetical protein [Streptomyces zagrosensis]|uniref:Uncharacterized protein n=1 Tax=Streptomyces zagrosensis TaxID=1042984 RepID=A0A7W9QFK2_9ACTN|nr:hypothetical protein [Streptomyces zagrosensis]MBB5939216.1 hypothetical protein [Streptomyces zagrosensis]
MSMSQIDGGLGWLGRYASYQDRAGQDVSGMRAGISLTAIRGPALEDWLLRLGADRSTIGQRVPYRQFAHPALPDPASIGMFGTCGEWTFILEDSLAATWFLAHFSEPAAVPREDEALVCVTLNHHDAPSAIAYSPPGTDVVWTTEFGVGMLEDRLTTPEDPARELASFDETLARAGALHSKLNPPRPWREIRDNEWATAVYRAVGDHFGISISRTDVEEGLLPAVALPLR